MRKSLKHLISGMLAKLDQGDSMFDLSDEQVKELILKFPPSQCIGRCVPFIFSVPRGRFIYLGSKFEAITGHDPKEVIKLPVTELLPLITPGDHLLLTTRATSACFDELRKHYNDRYDIQVNVDQSMVRKDGSLFRAMLQYRPLVWDQEGNIKVTGGFLVDISHLKMHGQPVVTLTAFGEVVFKYEPDSNDLLEEELTDYSRRELELLRMMAKGDDIADIVSKTGLSRATVYAHRRNILAKSELPSIGKVIESLRTRGLLS